jgi:hypothetical protein
MQPKANNRLSLTLATLLPCMPLVRSALPALQSAAPSTWGIVFRWAAGGLAMFGYHAISSASSVAISPASATIGVPYSGTITYSGGHAGAVSSMKINGVCLGSYTVAPGLTAQYTGVNTASVTGTPTGGLGTAGLTVTVYDFSCGSGLNDTRSTSLIIQNSGGGPVAPTMSVVPQNVVAQVGSDVLLSGGASGNPTPGYYWKQGITLIPNATNNTLLIPAVQLTNSGVFTLVATNSQSQAQSACYVSVVETPGSNSLALDYTNYVPANTALTMYSYLTNVPAATNNYSWSFASTPIGVTTSNLTLTAGQTGTNKTGTYSIAFTSHVLATVVVNGESYDSYWAFGFLPSITSQPVSQSTNAGSNVTFSVTLNGTTPTLLWYQNQTNLVAAQSLTFAPPNSTTTTTASLTLSNVAAAHAGNYTVAVTNSWGSTLSSSAALTVIPALSVTSPQSQTNYAGKAVNLTVTATGAAPISYRWQKGGLNLFDGGTISGASTNTLAISPASTANNGNYQVVVTNSTGSLTSGLATLTILPVPPVALSTGPGGASLSGGGGVANSSYVVQVSTNLANPAAWVPLKTNVVPSNGAISFTDTNSSSSGQHFYRLQFP